MNFFKAFIRLQSFNATHIYSHADFGGESDAYDIALIRLNQAAVLTNYVDMIPLPPPGKTIVQVYINVQKTETVGRPPTWASYEQERKFL